MEGNLKIMKNIRKMCILVLVIMLFSAINVNAEQVEEIKTNQITITSLAIINGENGYNATVTGDAVNFRSSPYLSNTNIIRTLYYGHPIAGNYSKLNIYYNNGYYWSYVKDKVNGDWGYIASKYFAIDSPMAARLLSMNLRTDINDGKGISLGR